MEKRRTAIFHVSNPGFSYLFIYHTAAIPRRVPRPHLNNRDEDGAVGSLADLDDFCSMNITEGWNFEGSENVPDHRNILPLNDI